MKTKQNGFTLIELLVVIAIIAILAIAIAVGYQSVRDSANDAKRVEALRSIATAQEIYHNQNNRYTGNVEELEVANLDSIYPRPNASDQVNKWNHNVAISANNQLWRGMVSLVSKDAAFCCNRSGCAEIENERWGGTGGCQWE